MSLDKEPVKDAEGSSSGAADSSSASGEAAPAPECEEGYRPTVPSLSGAERDSIRRASTDRLCSGIVCPSCGSSSVVSGEPPLWATAIAVLGFFLICFLLLFLLIAEGPSRCLECGREYG